MDGRLQEISDVFGSFYAKEVDMFRTCVRAGLYYEQNKLEKAFEAMCLAQSQLTKELRFEIHFCVFMLLSNILDALGKPTESEKVREQFKLHIKEENALYLNPNFLAVDTKNKLLYANWEAAKEWLEQFFVTDGEPLHFYKLYQYFTTVRAYIVLSEPEKAEDILEKLKKLCVNYRRPLDVAEVYVLQSALCWATGFQKEDMELLEEALLAMQPYRVIRIIADEGAAVLPILKKITFRIERAEYSGELDSQIVPSAEPLSNSPPDTTEIPFNSNLFMIVNLLSHFLQAVGMLVYLFGE